MAINVNCKTSINYNKTSIITSCTYLYDLKYITNKYIICNWTEDNL